jgi:hypothetical protein
MAQLIAAGALPSTYRSVGWSSQGSSGVGGQGLATIIRNVPNAATASAEPSEIMTTWRESNASTVRVPYIQLHVIEQLYTLMHRDRVLRFLNEHPFLVTILLEAYGQIGVHFPPSRLFLDVVTDPEVAGAEAGEVNSEELVLSIATRLDVKEALDRLVHLDNDWWLAAVPRAEGKLCINLEFQ